MNLYVQIMEITNIMDILELVAIWRLKYPDLLRYTWLLLNQASRLDYFLMSFSLAPKCTSVDKGQNAVGPSKKWYTHYSYRINARARILEWYSKPTGRQLVLNQDRNNYKFLFFLHNMGTTDPLIVWDTFKCAFRGHAIQYSSLKQ
jgi:hypothetical protein